MANKKITAYDGLSTPALADVVVIVDVSNISNNASGETNKATLSNISKGIVVTNLDVTGLTASQLLRVNSGGTAIESSGKTVPTGDIVGTTDTQTLSAKTLTSPIINSPALSADSVDAITEIAAALKSGSDTKLITGTAGTLNYTSKWNTDGDLVDGFEVLDEDDMGSDSATAIATQQSIKAYVDSGTVTFTNKRNTERVTTITSSATPTVNTDDSDWVDITALATAITSMTTNLSGTPLNKDVLIFEIKDNGTGRAITWGASFVAHGVALPTTTTASKILTVGFRYTTANSLNKWGCVASVEEA